MLERYKSIKLLFFGFDLTYQKNVLKNLAQKKWAKK
jgi:hypothetical protein